MKVENRSPKKKQFSFIFIGAEIATGETLTFLDAHIECSPGWLQYLLYEVKKDRYIDQKFNLLNRHLLKIYN